MNGLLIFLSLLTLFFVSSYYYFYLKLLDPKKISIPTEGKVAELSKGKLFYQWFSPEEENGETIILVHGFSTPSVVWGGILPFLQKEGYKVLAYDHYGRGYSSRPKTKYTKNLFIETLDELIGSQVINQKIHLVGYSMGGPIVAGFAESYPEKVKSISLIAPAGYLTLSLPWYRKFLYRVLTLPILSQYIGIVVPSLFYGGDATIKLSTLEDANHVSQEKITQVYKEQMKYEGFTRSLLSTIKNFNLFNDKDSFKTLGQLNIPTSVVWGTADETCSFDGHKELRKDISNIFSTVIEDGYHDITYSMPTKVSEHLINFLKQL